MSKVKAGAGQVVDVCLMSNGKHLLCCAALRFLRWCACNLQVVEVCRRINGPAMRGRCAEESGASEGAGQEKKELHITAHKYYQSLNMDTIQTISPLVHDPIYNPLYTFQAIVLFKGLQKHA